ncbi:MAG TPA: lysyl oxidase family protein [Solirubrobacterales bacterium]|nr:lysyl oxidase family protein [Solirubrobacterales bacterium]
MPLRRFALAPLVALAASLLLSGDVAGTPRGSASANGDEPNPCTGPHAGRLRCPDIQMGTPANLTLDRYEGRVVLRAENNLKSRGEGPIMLRGRRSGARTMNARQHIYRQDGTRLIERTGARLYFKYVEGQGHYWKWQDAARFELWSLNPDGTRNQLVRTGPKVHYCLRDLKRTSASKRSPRGRVFPGCSQDSTKREVTLGTSVGWSDVYPSPYYQQWIDVTGLRGCFAYVHRADPKNHVWENFEGNNDAQRIVRLPWRGTARGCPGA